MLSREEQIKMGNAFVQERLAELDKKGLPYNEAIDKRTYDGLKGVFERVHAVSHLRNEKWEVILHPDMSFNA